LAVEEQFYLFWPLVVFMCSRQTLRRVCTALLFLVPVLRLALMWVLRPHFASMGQDGASIGSFALYQFTLSHVDAFAFGALVVCDARWLTRPRNLLPFFALAAVVTGVNGALLARQHVVSPLLTVFSLGFPGTLQHNYQYVWGYTMVDALSALVIAACVGGASGATRFRVLESPILERIGKISYGMYLFHNPIRRWLQAYWPYDIRRPGALLVFVVFMVLVYAVSEVSFRYFESWFLSARARRRLGAEVEPALSR
jgi:peptidoglycan/LPS O-acetylase OafA/YrhL